MRFVLSFLQGSVPEYAFCTRHNSPLSQNININTDILLPLYQHYINMINNILILHEYYTVLDYIILSFVLLHYTLLHYTILYNTILYYLDV